MTRIECESIEPGMQCLIADDFVEDPYTGLEKYLGTIQVVERIEFIGSGWIYFEGLPQPFAFSEVVCVTDAPIIDDENIPYQLGDFNLIFEEVVS